MKLFASATAIIAGKESDGRKFEDYFDYREGIARIPPHRAMALFRGESEGVLKLSLDLPDADTHRPASVIAHPCERRIAVHFEVRESGRPGDGWLAQTVSQAWKTRLRGRVETDARKRLARAGQ